VRQLRYSAKNENSLDLVLFLNGIPIFTTELKNPLTGQNVADAIAQYKRDRDPREKRFAYGRCLGHFAVDPSRNGLRKTLSSGRRIPGGCLALDWPMRDVS
jgi:type I restriction enzyme, R subunit